MLGDNARLVIFLINRHFIERILLMPRFSFHPNTKTAYWLTFSTLALVAIVVGLIQTMPTSDDTLVFMRLDGDMEIYTVEADGSNEQQLTNNEFEDWAAVWSPDKSRIYFHSNREGYFAIYSMNRDGSDVYRETPAGFVAQYPTISPDGRYLAFQMLMDGMDDWDIFVMEIGCSNMQRITFSTAHEGGPAFSPDGSKIAYHSTEAGYFDIYVVNLDGSGTNRLTNYTETMDVWPQWSADSSQILFHSERTGNSELFIMNADGSNQVNLSNNPSLDRTPRYSADGKHIIFRSERNGNSELYMMNLDGSNPQPITQSTLMNFYPDS
jgi:Tol biopolymer transport system component